MRDKILAVMEKNARIDLHDLATLLGEPDAAVANEIADMEAGRPEPAWPPWLRHFQQLASEKNLENYHGLRSYEGWTFVLSETSRSSDSIRLDYNENERVNRRLLAGEIIYYGDKERRYALRAAKRPGFGYNVWDVSWYESTNPVAKPLPAKTRQLNSMWKRPHEMCKIISTFSRLSNTCMRTLKTLRIAFCKCSRPLPKHCLRM